MTESKVTQRSLLIFWLPFAATWLMMALEGPFIAAVIARLPDLKVNLAAYGIAFAIGLFLEAPIMMLISASVALVRDRESFFKLRNFMLILNLLITAAMGSLLIPPVYRVLVAELMDLPDELHSLTYTATALLLAWPAAIGFRRFYQGILIRGGHTGKVAVGTIVRLAGMSGTALFLTFHTDFPGAWVGCAALSAGVSMEAFATWLMARSSIKEVIAIRQPAGKTLTYRAIWSFYYPLACSSVIALGVRPLVSFFVAHCQRPLDSLAVLPVVNSTSFLFVSFGISFQEVALAVMGDRFEHFRPVRRFALNLTAILTLANAILVFSSLATNWFMVVSNLPMDLTRFALLPFRITLMLPALAVAQSIQRAVLVNAHRNPPITWSTVLEVGTIAAGMVIFSTIIPLDGVVAAVIALVMGRSISNLFLYRFYRKQVSMVRVRNTPAQCVEVIC